MKEFYNEYLQIPTWTEDDIKLDRYTVVGNIFENPELLKK